LPQLALFDVVSTHPPPQAVRPVLHAAAHVPELQTELDMHALPHMPQLAALVLRSTHAPLHSVPAPQPDVASPEASVWTTSPPESLPIIVPSPPIVASFPVPLSGFAASFPVTFLSFETNWSLAASGAVNVLSPPPQLAKEAVPSVAMRAAASLPRIVMVFEPSS
jgi:hypothetical protein